MRCAKFLAPMLPRIPADGNNGARHADRCGAAIRSRSERPPLGCLLKCCALRYKQGAGAVETRPGACPHPEGTMTWEYKVLQTHESATHGVIAGANLEEQLNAI